MRRAVTVACLGVVVAASLSAQQRTSSSAQTAAADATARIVASAQALLATLDEAGRAKVQFPFDSPQKTRWSNLPTGIFKREGLRLGDLTPTQRAAAMALLSTALSPDGYRKVVEIMGGDEVLRGRVGRRGAGVRFGEDEYYLAFLGVPSVQRPVDAAVRRTSPRDQHDVGGAASHAGAQSHRGSTRHATRSRAAPFGPWGTKTTARSR